MKSEYYKINSLRKNNPQGNTSIELVNFIFFDIETTGYMPDKGAKITEVAILTRNYHQFEWHFKKNAKDEAIQNQIPKILKYLKTGVVVGHNLSFDIWFISYEAERLELAGPNIRFIDTLSLAQKILPDRNCFKLIDLLRLFDINCKGDLHTATTDAEATRALFWKLIEKGGISTVGEAGMKKLNWSSF